MAVSDMMRLALDAWTTRVIRRCYKGEAPGAVLHRAMRMLADADGHLTPDGRIIPAQERVRKRM